MRRLRDDEGLTLEQLGDRCDMDPAYVSRVEQGHKDVQLSTIVRIACALGVRPALLLEDLACPEDSTTPPSR